MCYITANMVYLKTLVDQLGPYISIFNCLLCHSIIGFQLTHIQYISSRTFLDNGSLTYKVFSELAQLKASSRSLHSNLTCLRSDWRGIVRPFEWSVPKHSKRTTARGPPPAVCHHDDKRFASMSSKWIGDPVCVRGPAL